MANNRITPGNDGGCPLSCKIVETMSAGILAGTSVIIEPPTEITPAKANRIRARTILDPSGTGVTDTFLIGDFPIQNHEPTLFSIWAGKETGMGGIRTGIEVVGHGLGSNGTGKIGTLGLISRSKCCHIKSILRS
jgi:hypothetical protein